MVSVEIICIGANQFLELTLSRYLDQWRKERGKNRNIFNVRTPPAFEITFAADYAASSVLPCVTVMKHK